MEQHLITAAGETRGGGRPGQLHGPLQRLQADADAGAAHAQPAAAAGARPSPGSSAPAWRRASSRVATRPWTWAWRPACWPASWSGYVTGLVSGVLISIPAMLNGEYLTMPLLAAVGRAGRPAARLRSRHRGHLALLAAVRPQHLPPLPARARPPADGVPPVLPAGHRSGGVSAGDAGTVSSRARSSTCTPTGPLPTRCGSCWST